MSSNSPSNDILEQIKRQIKQEEENKKMKKLLQKQYKEVSELKSKLSSIDELKQIIVNSYKDILSKNEELEKRVDELEKRVNHKHEWVEDEEKHALICKDCGETVPLPKSYTKIQRTTDVLRYIFKKHVHGDKEYPDMISCPYCREDLVNYLKQNGIQAELKGDELRVKLKK